MKHREKCGNKTWKYNVWEKYGNIIVMFDLIW